ncbi:MAG: L-threonylcarbamoyladenylate synthase, partial [Brachymonas sp.]
MSELTVAQAADLIAAGSLVAFPTETVYGLGADATSNSAVAQIFAVKGRPADHPLIVHVADAAAAEYFADAIAEFVWGLMKAFWPGPLTVIVPRKPGIAKASAGGQDSIGLRCPSHPLALELLRECAQRGVHGVSAPSANKFGKVSPTTAEHVRQEFEGAVPVLDGGACQMGIESTIIDCTRGAPILLRPGTLTKAQIEAELGRELLLNNEHAAEILRRQGAKNGAGLPAAPRASGMLESHYAPRAPLRLMDAQALQTALNVLGADAKHIAVYARSALKIASNSL